MDKLEVKYYDDGEVKTEIIEANRMDVESGMCKFRIDKGTAFITLALTILVSDLISFKIIPVIK